MVGVDMIYDAYDTVEKLGIGGQKNIQVDSVWYMSL